MKRIVFIVMIVFLLICTWFLGRKYFQTSPREKYILESGNMVRNIIPKLQDGDIIFQVSQSGQSIAIQNATHSVYSHCGVIFHKQDKWYVLEASRVVTFTPLDKFIAKGREARFVIKRLKGMQPTEISRENMRIIQDHYLGKPYDLYFGWSDNRMYCSELVWKLYRDLFHTEVGKLEKLKDFDLTSSAVRAKLRERYGNQIPLDETVISPADIFNCEKLEEIKAGS